MRALAFLIVGVGLLAGAGEPAGNEAKQTLDSLQGHWTMVSFEVNGEAIPEEQVKTGSLVVEQDRYTPSLGARRASFSIQLDPAPDPKAIDFTPTEGPEKGKTLKGIYMLAGDRFTVCRGLTDANVRPTEFATGAESGSSLVVWRRRKPAEERPAIEREKP
jgi:uncharacterized protein (TIGR03067 family)